MRQRYVGYCTNVHAGNTLGEIRANLERHALPVKQQIAPDRPMGIGLWLPSSVAEQVWREDQGASLRDYLQTVGLTSFTLNGFPYGDFHQDVVKHDVYLPTWCQDARRHYTQRLIDILHVILPPGIEGSISTLPIAWGTPPLDDVQLRSAAHQLLEAARYLERLEHEHGRLIYLCIEPEPGCALERSRDITNFFTKYLFPDDEHLARRYLRVCHDVCHAAVMFEPQATVLQQFRAAGILVGKVQVSSAVQLKFNELSEAQRGEALQQLRSFAEHRYLHQTVVHTGSGQEHFFEDLPLALAAADADTANLLDAEWRVHFHVPVYLDKFGLVDTSRSDIEACLNAALADEQLLHYEVETYAWNVLPPALRQARLADGIAQEMRWFEDLMRSHELHFA